MKIKVKLIIAFLSVAGFGHLAISATWWKNHTRFPAKFSAGRHLCSSTNWHQIAPKGKYDDSGQGCSLDRVSAQYEPYDGVWRDAIGSGMKKGFPYWTINQTVELEEVVDPETGEVGAKLKVR